MKKVLSEQALEQFFENGFVRTGIILPENLIDLIRTEYGDQPGSRSNWNYFARSAEKRRRLKGVSDRIRAALGNLRSRRADAEVQSHLYEKALYGSSGVLYAVLDQCLKSGLVESLDEIPLLVGHDILLQGSKYHMSFGFHDDGFGWDIFFQTGDDVSIYIPLQSLDESSGGRLCVEKRPGDSSIFQERNEYIVRFADFCRIHAGSDSYGRVTRLAAEQCSRSDLIDEEYQRLSDWIVSRRESQQGQVQMNPIDAGRGEVILFNNKMFHDVEPWRLAENRSVYIVRCSPLYEMGLAPPSSFLNDVECNRYLIEPSHASFRAVRPEKEDLPFVPVPS